MEIRRAFHPLDDKFSIFALENYGFAKDFS